MYTSTIIGILCLFQYVTERMGGAEGTRLDNEFMEMERVSFLFLSLLKDSE